MHSFKNNIKHFLGYWHCSVSWSECWLQKHVKFVKIQGIVHMCSFGKTLLKKKLVSLFSQVCSVPRLLPAYTPWVRSSSPVFQILSLCRWLSNCLLQKDLCSELQIFSPAAYSVLPLWIPQGQLKLGIWSQWFDSQASSICSHAPFYFPTFVTGTITY